MNELANETARHREVAVRDTTKDGLDSRRQDGPSTPRASLRGRSKIAESAGAERERIECGR